MNGNDINFDMKIQLYHNKEFFSVEKDFPKFLILEQNYKEILDEFLEVNKMSRVKKENGVELFEPWVERNLYQESNEHGWDVAPLMIGGEKIEERCELFPKLISLTNQINGIMSISFSLLKPGTHIVPHRGYDDYSEKMLRYHLGIIVPEGDLGLRVEKKITRWENGQSFIFDDYLIHEAWNFSQYDRIVLIIDFLRDESMMNVAFVDKNFNNSIKGYFKNK